MKQNAKNPEFFNLTRSINDAYISQWKIMIKWIRRTHRGLERSDLLFQPAPQINHLWFNFGHIIVAIDLGPALKGAEPYVSKEMHQKFGFGAKPDPEGANYPSMEELHTLFEKIWLRNRDLIESISADEIEEKPMIEINPAFAALWNTKGRIIEVATLHASYHNGQSNLLRKMLGKLGPAND